MTLRIPAKVLLHVWSYDFYDMTLSTGKQRRHMIKNDKMLFVIPRLCARALKIWHNISHNDHHSKYISNSQHQYI